MKSLSESIKNLSLEIVLVQLKIDERSRLVLSKKVKAELRETKETISALLSQDARKRGVRK